jgi:hypothetical protein
MLTGEVPFHAETPMAVMLKHIVETPALPHLHNPTIRPAVDDVIMKAIAKSPADRYAHATDLAGAYEMALDSGATLPTATTISASTVTPAVERRRKPWPIVAGIAIALIAVIAVVALIIATRSDSAPSTVQLGANLLDDFSGATVNPATWKYRGTFPATFDSPAVAIQNGRVVYVIQNKRDEYLDGGLQYTATQPLKMIAARVSLVDATDSSSDIGLEVNGLDAEPDSWAYLTMAPTDGTVYAYVGHTRYDSAEEVYTLVQGTGMPATHELAIGWDGNQLTFYVDGQARKSLPTKQMGQWARLLFDVGPQANISGSFDDVRITYAEQ